MAFCPRQHTWRTGLMVNHHSVFVFLEYKSESDPNFWVGACSQASLVFHADTARVEPS
jgi:hypothetical protein